MQRRYMVLGDAPKRHINKVLYEHALRPGWLVVEVYNQRNDDGSRAQGYCTYPSRAGVVLACDGQYSLVRMHGGQYAAGCRWFNSRDWAISHWRLRLRTAHRSPGMSFLFGDSIDARARLFLDALEHRSFPCGY